MFEDRDSASPSARIDESSAFVCIANGALSIKPQGVSAWNGTGFVSCRSHSRLAPRVTKITASPFPESPPTLSLSITTKLAIATLITTALILASSSPPPSIASTSTSTEYNINTPDALGVVDDLLADCPPSTPCLSSQDDRPSHFREPWEYSAETSPDDAFNTLLRTLQLQNARILNASASSRYIHAEFASGKNARFSDQAEFYFTPNDALVQFRVFRVNTSKNATISRFDFSGSQDKRLELIRRKCGWTEVPVLRNRRRVFVWFESPWDSFGPTTEKNMDVVDMFERASRSTGGGFLKSAEDYTGKFDSDPLAPPVQPLRGKR